MKKIVIALTFVLCVIEGFTLPTIPLTNWKFSTGDNLEWAKVYLQNNRVMVESDEVLQPVAVRYAWESDPVDVNLFQDKSQGFFCCVKFKLDI